MPSLAHLFADENINVQKKVILSFATIYRSALQVSLISLFETRKLLKVVMQREGNFFLGEWVHACY